MYGALTFLYFDCLKVNIPINLQLCVHRNDVIVSTELHAVSGVIHHSPLRGIGGVREFSQRLHRLFAREIGFYRYRLKSNISQSHRQQLSIVDWVCKRTGITIIPVSDQKRNAILLNL